MNSLIDIENKICKFNNDIFFILEEKNQPWFKGVDVSRILGYKNPRRAIYKNIDKIDTKQYNELGMMKWVTPLNMQSSTIFINESAL